MKITKKKSLVLIASAALAILLAGIFILAINTILLMQGKSTSAVLAVGETSGTCGDNATWTFDSQSKTLTISGEGAIYNYNISEGYVPGWYASWLEEIEVITIEEGITSIGTNVFHGCWDVKSMTIPGTITTLDGYFIGLSDSLEEIIINDGVKAIANDCFNGCSSLTSVVLPDSIESIGFNAFYGCTSLTEIYLGKGLRSIGTSAFVVNAYDSAVGGHIDIYLNAKYDDFANESEITSLFEDICGAIVGNAGSAPEASEGALEYVIDEGYVFNQKEVVNYNSAFDFSGYVVRPATIHFDSSLKSYYDDVFANVDSNKVSYDDTYEVPENPTTPTEPQTPTTNVAGAIWEFGLSWDNAKETIKINFYSNGEEFEGIYYICGSKSGRSLVYITDMDSFISNGRLDANSLKVEESYNSDEQNWINEGYKTIVIPEGQTAYNVDIDPKSGKALLVAYDTEFNALLESLATYKGTSGETPSTGVALNISIIITSIVLLGAVLVVMNKKKEQN